MVESVAVAVVVVAARNRTCGGGDSAAISTTGLLARHEEAALHRSDLDKRRRLDNWEIMLCMLINYNTESPDLNHKKGDPQQFVWYLHE